MTELYDEEIESIEKFMEVHTNPVQNDIIVLLNIFGELSTAELSNLLGKSKPTVLKYLKDLIDLDIIEIREDPNARGSINKHYYRFAVDLSKTPRIKFEPPEEYSEEAQREYTLKILLLTKSLYEGYKRIVEKTIEFFSNSPESKLDFIDHGKMGIMQFYFSEEQMQEAKEIYEQYVLDLTRINNKAKRGEYRPYYYAAQVLKLGDIMKD
jgi:predicted transcriptional regulator